MINVRPKGIDRDFRYQPDIAPRVLRASRTRTVYIKGIKDGFREDWNPPGDAVGNEFYAATLGEFYRMGYTEGENTYRRIFKGQKKPKKSKILKGKLGKGRPT